MSCSMPGCKNNRRFKPDGISFHCFPRCGDLLKTWLSVLGKNIETWTWSKNKLICSLHFFHGDFFIKGGRRVLKVSAVPSITKGAEDYPTYEASPIVSDEIIEERTMLQHNETSLINSEGTETCTTMPFFEESQTILKEEPSDLPGFDEHENSPTDRSANRRTVAFVKTIHNYSMSPQKMKKRYDEMKIRQAKYRKQLHMANKTIALLQKEKSSLKKILKELRSEFPKEHVEKSVPPVLMVMFSTNEESGVTIQEQIH